MKDEHGGVLIIKFVGLKTNMYAIIDESNNEKCTIKGHNAFYRLTSLKIYYFEKRFLDIK